jgi:hypothetical protein
MLCNVFTGDLFHSNWCVSFSINYSNFTVPIVLSISLILSSYTLSLSHNETTNQLYSEFSICQPAYSGVAWKDFKLSEGCNKSCSYSRSSAKCILERILESDTTVLGMC